MFQQDGKSVAEGTSDRLGFYELVFTEQRAGAAVGTNRVTVSRTDAKGQETLPAVYNSQTTLERLVRSGENQIDFSLTTKPQPKQPPAQQPRKAPADGS